MKVKVKVPPLYKNDHLEVGEFADDGSIYLGHYHDKDWFVAAEDTRRPDGRITMTFNQAHLHAKALNVHGHEDWQLPSPDILREMFKHKEKNAFRDGFRAAAGYWYWSSDLMPRTKDSPFLEMARVISFEQGGITEIFVENGMLARCVRAVPHLKK